MGNNTEEQSIRTQSSKAARRERRIQRRTRPIRSFQTTTAWTLQCWPDPHQL